MDSLVRFLHRMDWVHSFRFQGLGNRGQIHPYTSLLFLMLFLLGSISLIVAGSPSFKNGIDSPECADQTLDSAPNIKVRLANPQFNCNTDQYCLEVQFQSDLNNQRLFGMNVRFFYDDVLLELVNFTGFEAGYAAVAPNPPINSYSGSAGPALFNFGGGADFINGAIQLTNENLPPIYLSTTDWTKIFQICFTVDDPNVDINNFCPPVVLDLEANPLNGGFLPGSDGIVMTVWNQGGGSLPANELVVQYNWQYIGNGSSPYGQPINLTCSSINCMPNISCPVNITIACGASTLPSNTGNASATVLCNGGPTITYSDEINGSCPNIHVITRTWQASDNCGNSATCMQYISVGGSSCNRLVTSTADSGTGTLRAAIDCAFPGDTVTFSANLFGATINLTSTRILINKNIYIRSDVSPRVKINSQVSGLFEIASNITAEFKDLDLTSGIAVADNQGAAFNNNGKLRLINMKVYKNSNLATGQYLIRNKAGSQFNLFGNCFIEIP